MTSRRTLPRRFAVPTLLSALTLMCAPFASANAQTGAPLSPADLLDIRSVSVGDYSPDGRWLLVRIAKRADGLGYVAAREGDPSYTRPAPARLLLMNAATGDTTPILSAARTLGSVAWSRDGAGWQTTRDSGRSCSRGSSLHAGCASPPWGARGSLKRATSWTDDGRLLVAIRERTWLPEVRARLIHLSAGPSRAGGDRTVSRLGYAAASWESGPRRGTPVQWYGRHVVSATQVSSWVASRSGEWVSWREDQTARTNYDGAPGAEARLWARRGRDSARIVLPSMRGVTFAQARDGDRFAFGRDGAVYVASFSDTTPKRLVGPAPRARGQNAPAAGSVDSSAAAREERFTLVRMAPTGDALLVSSRTGLHVVRIADGSRRTISAITDTVRGPRVSAVDWTGDGKTLLLSSVSRVSWDRALMRVDAASGATDTLVHDARLYGTPRLSPDGSRLSVVIGDNARPADLWLADGRFGAPRRVLASNPQLATRPLPRTQLVNYLDADGRSQFGVLTLPPGDARALPTVFSVYEDFFDDTFDATTMYLASRGYAVMKPSVTFETGYPGEAWLKGVTASANKLIEMGITDSAKLGVHGTSYGGYATNLLITQTNRFKAAINVSGKVDIISFYTDSPRLGVRNVNAAEKTQDRIGATLWEQPQKYVQHSAVMFADRIKTPLLLMTGGEDHNVPAINTREMYFALRRLGKPVEWVNYTNGGHGIPMTNVTEFTDWHTRLIGWYDRYLKPKPASVPASENLR
jgi:dipeptidyl aminopeptidase/acylaminoacyl peptidase